MVHPAVSIITSVFHSITRGNWRRLASIATEKAGICKRGRPVVSGVREASDMVIVGSVSLLACIESAICPAALPPR